MATKFDILKKSLIKKYQKIGKYFEDWNLSTQQIANKSDKYHMRRNQVMGSWGRKYGQQQNGKTPIDTRIDQIMNAKSMEDLEIFKKEIGKGTVRDFLNFQVEKVNREAWIESVTDKFGVLYAGINRLYGVSKIEDIHIYIDELEMYVKDLDPLSISYEGLNRISELIEMFYEEAKDGNKDGAKSTLLDIAEIVYNNKKYNRFKSILDNTL